MANSPEELKEFVLIMDRVTKVYDRLPDKAATVAVNFSKQRFIEQGWYDQTLELWKKRLNDKGKDAGRSILVKTAQLKRDVQKLRVTKDEAIIGTTKLTGKYAKAHNEGFKGTVMVKEHIRKHFKFTKENYKTRSGKERTRTNKVVDTSGETKVKSHLMKMNLPMRKFLGTSALMDKQIEEMMTNEIVKAITNG